MSDMNVLEYQRLGAPANWTPERDIEEFTHRYGETNNYFAEVMRQVQDACASLHKGLGQACGYFGLAEPPSSQIPEKISRLREHFLKNFPSDGYRERFLEALDYADWAEWQRRRLLRIYASNSESTWLIPLVKLADHLATADHDFQEGMSCEHDDYKWDMT